MRGNRIYALREGEWKHWLGVGMGYLPSLCGTPQTCENSAPVLGCARPTMLRVGGIEHKKEIIFKCGFKEEFTREKKMRA